MLLKSLLDFVSAAICDELLKKVSKLLNTKPQRDRMEHGKINQFKTSNEPGNCHKGTEIVFQK